VVGERAFVGEDAPERAAAHMRDEPAETADGRLDVWVSERTGTTPP
jgi:hypothetical protein